MQRYKRYLAGCGYAGSTIARHAANLRPYLAWCASEGIAAEAAGPDCVASWLAVLRQRGLSRGTLGNSVQSLRHYYASLGYSAETNPAAGLTVLRPRAALPSDLFSAAELRALYRRFRARRDYYRPHLAALHTRNCVCAGLLLFQGLHGGALCTLRVGDIDSAAAAVRIAGTRRSAARVLALEAEQVPAVQALIQGRAATAPLFEPASRDVQRQVLARLKALEPRVRSLAQLRASVIAAWVASCGLRRAQYQAGHRHIGSTERYKIPATAALAADLARYHPLNRED